MPEVKTRKLIFVKAVINDTATFSRKINVPFDYHDMIVRSWNVGLTGSAVNLYTLHMQGFGDIFHFSQQENSTPKHIFRSVGPMSGDIEFTVLDVNGIPDGTTADAQILFCLEFVEYFPYALK
jgi:hypothetical protein